MPNVIVITGPAAELPPEELIKIISEAFMEVPSEPEPCVKCQQSAPPKTGTTEDQPTEPLQLALAEFLPESEVARAYKETALLLEKMDFSREEIKKILTTQMTGSAVTLY